MKLIATHAIHARHLELRKSGRLPVLARQDRPGRPEDWKSLQQHLIEKGPPVRTPIVRETRKEIEIGTPTGQAHPERLVKSDGGFHTSVTPPFVNRLEAPYQRYRDNLGAMGIQALDALYEMGARALGSSFARLTSRYDPNFVDAPGHRDYAHMSHSQRQEFIRFHEIWKQLDEDLQRIAHDLVFELVRPDRDKPLTIAEVGRELSNYQDERRAIGGAVVGLRLLAARILFIMRQERRRAR